MTLWGLLWGGWRRPFKGGPFSGIGDVSTDYSSSSAHGVCSCKQTTIQPLKEAQ